MRQSSLTRLLLVVVSLVSIGLLGLNGQGYTIVDGTLGSRVFSSCSPVVLISTPVPIPQQWISEYKCQQMTTLSACQGRNVVNLTCVQECRLEPGTGLRRCLNYAGAPGLCTDCNPPSPNVGFYTCWTTPEQSCHRTAQTEFSVDCGLLLRADCPSEFCPVLGIACAPPPCTPVATTTDCLDYTVKPCDQ
jgi:hypothetical protein